LVVSTSEIGRISLNARWSHINCLGRRVHASSPTMSRVCHLLHLSAWKMRNPLVILLEVSGLVSIDECDYEHQSKLEVAVGCSWWSVNILAENEAACLLLATCGPDWRRADYSSRKNRKKQLLCVSCALVTWPSGLKLQSAICCCIWLHSLAVT